MILILIFFSKNRRGIPFLTLHWYLIQMIQETMKKNYVQTTNKNRFQLDTYCVLWIACFERLFQWNGMHTTAFLLLFTPFLYDTSIIFELVYTNKVFLFLKKMVSRRNLKLKCWTFIISWTLIVYFSFIWLIKMIDQLRKYNETISSLFLPV